MWFKWQRLYQKREALSLKKKKKKSWELLDRCLGGNQMNKQVLWKKKKDWDRAKVVRVLCLASMRPGNQSPVPQKNKQTKKPKKQQLN
jgi:hypothetical protein